MGRIAGLLLLLALVVAGACLAYFNAGPVRFDYLAGALELPLIFLLLAAFAVGAVLAMAAGAARRVRARMELRRLTRELAAAETELKALRNLPLKP